MGRWFGDSGPEDDGDQEPLTGAEIDAILEADGIRDRAAARNRTHVDVLEPRLILMGPAGSLQGRGEPAEVGAQTFEPRVSMLMCQTADQAVHALSERDLHKELIKAEIVPAFGPTGVRSYRVIIWSLPWP